MTVKGLAALLLLLLLGAIATLFGAGWWLVSTEGGSRWLLERASARTGGKLVFEDVKGVLREELRIGRAGIDDPNYRVELRDIRARSDLHALLSWRLGIEYLHAGELTVALPPGDGKPPRLPERISLPIPLSITQAEVARVLVTRGEERYPASKLRFRYAGGLLVHEVRELRAELPWGGVAFDGEIETRRPFSIEGVAALSRPHPEYPMGISVELSGDFQRVLGSFTAKLADIAAKGEARVVPFSAAWLESLEGTAGPIDLATLDPSWPRTALTVHVNGSLSVNVRAGSGLAFEGTLSAVNAQPGTLDRGRVPVAKLSTRFSTDFAQARLEELALALSPGGALAGSGELTRDHVGLSLRAQGLNLRAFRSDLRQTALAGPLRIDASAERQAVKGTLSEDGIKIEADLLRAGNTVEVKSLRAEAKGGEITGTGQVHLGRPVAFDAKLALARFDPAQWGDFPPGSLSGAVVASGELSEPRRIEAQWTLADSLLRDQALTSRGKATVAGERITALDAQAQLGSNRATARGALGRKGDELAWTLEAPRLEQLAAQAVSQFSPGAKWGEGLSGRLRASGRFAGDLSAPRTTLTAQADHLTLPGGVAIDSVNAQGTLGLARDLPNWIELVARRVTARQLALDRLATRFAGTLSEHEADVSATAPGYDIEARLRGGWLEGGRQPRGWSGEVLALRNRGTYPLDLVAPVPLSLGPATVRIGKLQATLAQGRLTLQETSWEGGRLASSGQFNGLPAAWLIVPAGLGAQLKSSLLVDGQWSLRSTPRLNGTLSLKRSGGDLVLTGTPNIDLGLRALALDARLVEGRIAGQATLESRQGKLALKGEVAPVWGTSAGTSAGAGALGITRESPLEVSGRFDFTNMRALAQPFFTQGRVDGRLSADLRATGTLGKPLVTGVVRGDAISLEVPPYGVSLKEGRLRAMLEGDTLRVTEFSIRGGDGQFIASGTLPLRFADGAASIGWQAVDFRVLNRPDMRLDVSGSGNAGFDGKRLALKGGVRANNGYFVVQQNALPELAPDVVVLGQPRAGVKERPKLPLALDVSLDLGDDLFVEGWGFIGEIAGRVNLLTNENGEPRAFGRIQATGGTFTAYGQRLRVDPGVLIFDGPIDNPSLDLTAWRRNQAVEAGVQLTGTLRAPRVVLVSNPPAPEGEKLSWLVLGHAPGATTGADLALLQAAAGAILPRGRSAPINQRIATALKLDEVTLRGGSQLTDRVVAFGKRLSDRLYVTYEQGLGAAASNLVKLDFSLTTRLSARAETGTTSGVGLFYRFSWD